MRRHEAKTRKTDQRTSLFYTFGYSDGDVLQPTSERTSIGQILKWKSACGYGKVWFLSSYKWKSLLATYTHVSVISAIVPTNPYYKLENKPPAPDT